MKNWHNANDTPRFHQCEFAYICGSCVACPLYTVCDGMRDTVPPTDFANSWGSRLVDPTPERRRAVAAARRAGVQICLTRRLPKADIVNKAFEKGLLPLPVEVNIWIKNNDKLPLSKYQSYGQWLRQVRGE